MNFQTVVSFGDSLTNGARTYGCLPLSLAQELDARTGQSWRTVNKGVNGFTARDVWHVVNEYRVDAADVMYTLLVGTNDCKRLTEPSEYIAYVLEILKILQIRGAGGIFVGTIPLFIATGHPPYTKASEHHRALLNSRLRQAIGGKRVRLVDLEHVVFEEHLDDTVHWNNAGNTAVAKAFADEILDA